ncbi:MULTISPECIES: ECF transporter S component [unclassified Mycoplasma]|uniref:ECF transporter S component n=1 Tax=unclassified Mycoplasma TaxID=2683645 RepID=UPI00197C3E0A|nr:MULTISPECIES: ECF transporter S component [unclassified Mycoplasma]MBN4084382.1 ECF transporter S component [Mycoplasma sp. CSL10166]MBU4692868.1 ECF transporter S component [Mycoplasma sp. CSL7491-lung]
MNIERETSNIKGFWSSFLKNLFFTVSSIIVLIWAIINSFTHLETYNFFGLKGREQLSWIIWPIFLILLTINVYTSYREYSVFSKVNTNNKYLKKYKYLIIGNIFTLPLRFLILVGTVYEDEVFFIDYKLAKKRRNGSFTVKEISLAGVFLGLFIILTTITHYTIARTISFSFEYVFYIIFAFFFGKYKGSLLSFIADFFGLLISGKIGFYHWVYAIVPIISTFTISIFIEMFKNNKKLSYIFMDIFLMLVFTALIIIFIYKTGDPRVSKKGYKISEFLGLSYLSFGTMIGLSILSGILLIAFNIMIFWAFFTKNKKVKTKLNYMILFYFLIVSLIVISRWIWGPFAFIIFANTFLGKAYTLSNRYLILMYPIVLRSVIIIPIYTFVLYTIFVPLSFLKENKLLDIKKISYF